MKKNEITHKEITEETIMEILQKGTLTDPIENIAKELYSLFTNAKPIAVAAPDMLEALQKAVEVIERMSDEYSAIAGRHASYTNGEAKIIENAIKKATI